LRRKSTAKSKSLPGEGWLSDALSQSAAVFIEIVETLSGFAHDDIFRSVFGHWIEVTFLKTIVQVLYFKKQLVHYRLC
jgi:hypothetical protein